LRNFLVRVCLNSSRLVPSCKSLPKATTSSSQVFSALISMSTCGRFPGRAGHRPAA
jgi:hypothetical protein